MTSLSGFGVGHVLRSEDPSVKVGDHIYGILRRRFIHLLKIILKQFDIKDTRSTMYTGRAN